MSRSRQQASWPITALAKEYPRGWHIDRHRHRRGQLIYATSGVMQVTTREGVWIVPPQRSLWVPPRMEHELHMEGKVLVRTLYLDPPSSAAYGHHCRALAVSPLLRELILAAVQAHGDRRAARMAMIAPLLLHEMRKAPDTAFRIPMPSDPRLRRACQRLLEGMCGAETLEQLATRAGASSRTLARLFQSELHMSFVRWRQHVRLAHALSQMSLGCSIKTVARGAGYASCSAFISMFRRVLGVTPTAYLAQVAGETS